MRVNCPGERGHLYKRDRVSSSHTHKQIRVGVSPCYLPLPVNRRDTLLTDILHQCDVSRSRALRPIIIPLSSQGRTPITEGFTVAPLLDQASAHYHVSTPNPPSCDGQSCKLKRTAHAIHAQYECRDPRASNCIDPTGTLVASSSRCSYVHLHHPVPPRVCARWQLPAESIPLTLQTPKDVRTRIPSF